MEMDSQLPERPPCPPPPPPHSTSFSRERKKFRYLFCMRLVGQANPISTPWLTQRYCVAALTRTSISRSFISLYICYTDWDTSLIVTIFIQLVVCLDRLCGLVVRVSGYRYRGPGFDFRRYQIFWVVVGLERGPLSLVSSIEELLE
jgi:hypothetical protein